MKVPSQIAILVASSIEHKVQVWKKASQAASLVLEHADEDVVSVDLDGAAIDILVLDNQTNIKSKPMHHGAQTLAKLSSLTRMLVKV